MQLISPDVLAEARNLSPAATGFFYAIGLALWAAGWRWHRFWVVFLITMGAGLYGLSVGKSLGGQDVMVAGILMAVAAGLLALELARILAFVTGGTAAWIAAQVLLPQAQELWAVFLSGGLVGVILFRLWTMLATSLAGAVVSAHTFLILLGHFSKWDLVDWSSRHSAPLTGGVILLTLIGVILQARTAPAEEQPAAGESAHHSSAPAKEKNPKQAKPPSGGSGDKVKSWWRPFSL